MALRLAKDCSKGKFVLLVKGPSVLDVKVMEKKLDSNPSKSFQIDSSGVLLIKRSQVATTGP